MKTVNTFTVNIYVGFREKYSDIVHSLEEAENICQEFCDNKGLCVTVTPTKYVYTNGNEPGCIIGLINYPRFPRTKIAIVLLAHQLADIFLSSFNQYRISIVCPDETYMIGEE